MINAIPVPILSDNYVWMLSRFESEEAVVVDPGDVGPVLDILDQSNLKCAAVLLTHHHTDHVGGAAEIGKIWKCPVYGPIDESIPAVTHPVGEGHTLTAAGMTFKVLSVPGHTRGHIAFVGHGHLLCGDTLFAGGCGRIFEGTPSQMYDSLSRLAALDPKTLVCCAHEYTVSNLEFALQVEPGNAQLVDRLESARAIRSAGRPTLPSRLEVELATNPFLRCMQPEIIDVASRHAGRRLESGVEVFSEVRAWKDVY
ncbi:MAG: hydroxyacylglutathione hydrolase [Acidobacteria bacterium]|nr:MAG: hydroxyacylglutathione hydrolase [Acidobacteriota bacterium]